MISIIYVINLPRYACFFFIQFLQFSSQEASCSPRSYSINMKQPSLSVSKQPQKPFKYHRIFFCALTIVFTNSRCGNARCKILIQIYPKLKALLIHSKIKEDIHFGFINMLFRANIFRRPVEVPWALPYVWKSFWAKLIFHVRYMVFWTF